MKAASVKELKYELSQRSPKDLLNICLRLSKFKKENKELLTYLLFESIDEATYIESIKNDISDQFKTLNRKSFYLLKKGVRKILSTTKKYIRYSQKKETEVELLIYFSSQFKKNVPNYRKSVQLNNLYQSQIESITKNISSLHEDLQYDFEQDLDYLVSDKA
jgi:hypothetical protein